MRKRIFFVALLVTLPVLFCLLFTGCGRPQSSSSGERDSTAQKDESGVAANELEFSNPDVGVAYDSARTYYKELSLDVEEMNHNEEMDVAEFYVNENLDEYGEGNVVMFDAVAEGEPDIIRHIILVREDADSDWTVECEVLEES